MAMYKVETIKKYLDKMHDKIKECQVLFITDRGALETVKVSISDGNKKVGRVLNVSIAPIVTCPNCRECCKLCYDIKANLQYGNVLNARARNTVLALNYPEIYFGQIRDKMKRRRKNKYFRWHVGGDIPTYEYFCEMVEIAKEFPDFITWTYTKNYWIVNRYVKEHGNDRRVAIPENFTIMFSEWDGMPLVNPYDFPVFTCKLKDGNKNHKPEYFDTLYRCPGNCDICKAAHRGCIAGETTYANEH